MSLTALAESLLANAKMLDEHIAGQGLPPASFQEDVVSHGLPPELEMRRKAIIDDAQTLKRLALGPQDLYHEVLSGVRSPDVFADIQANEQFTDLMSLRAIYHWKLADAVPLNGEQEDPSYREIAKATGLDEGHVRRFLKHAMTNRIFEETEEGNVRHTAASRMLREDPELYDFVGLLADDFHPASAKVIEAMEKYPGSEEPNETGFNVEYNTSSPLYVELAKSSERMRRFRSGMSFSLRVDGLDLRHLTQGYDWSKIDVPGNTFVDVGGGHGDVTRALAGATKNMNFVLQDYTSTTVEAADLMPYHLKERVTFMPHDFFTPQPVFGAAIYFFRWILHDWSDKYCVKILQSLIPAMKEGSRVMLYEYVIPDMGHIPWSLKMVRNLDMMMKVCWNARVRTAADWMSLFARADPRYRFTGITRPGQSSMCLIEATFTPAEKVHGYVTPP